MLSQPLQVASLTCERRTEPLGVDVLAPRLAWMLKGDDRNRCQTAYEVRAGTRKGTADLWSSGKVESEESGGVAYAGRPLSSSEQVYWQVRVWDETGRASRWSRSGSWTMGVLRSEDWKGKWIGHAGPVPETLLLRREFRVHGGLRRAVIHVAGLGQYEMRMNGRKVGTDLLTPGWTDLRKTVLYDTYDVTKLLRTGVNAVGLLLGNGMDNVHEGRYTKLVGSLGPHKALAQIRLEYGDGTWDTIGTDDRWATHPGPITFSSVFAVRT